MQKFYVTTPIYYPNARPHLGSAYTTLIADSFARLYRSLGYEVFFLTGVDEHGEKIERTARAKGFSPKEFVDKMAVEFKKAWKKMDITYDRFIRTTDEDHEETVKDILAKIYNKDDIYRGKYEGYYCVACERYYTEKDLVDGKCPYHLKPVEKRKIDSYFFKLSKYKDRLIEFYNSNPSFLPPNYKREILDRLSELKDLSISRPKEQLSWGIELPFDEKHVTYVWFDALLNYLSGIGYISNKSLYQQFWPPDIEIMGKDIIWFHCVIWPAILMSAGLELPKRQVAHGFLTVDGRKMSKSLGNVVDPVEVVERWGHDALRYYLLFKVPFGSDGDFSWKIFEEMYSKELVGNIGNLANRIVVLSHKLLNDVVEFEVDERLSREVNTIIDNLNILSKNLDVERIISEGYSRVISFAGMLNAYLNEKEVWKTKDKNDMMNLLESLYILSVLLEPILPQASEKISSLFDGRKRISELKPFGKNVSKLPSEKRVILYKKEV